MPFPTGWPPRPAGNTRSIRFYKSGNATANFADNAFLFIDGVSADTYSKTPVVAPGDLTPVAFGDGTKSGTPAGASDNLDPATKPMIWCNTLVICNDGGADLEVSFDGFNVHDKIPIAEKLRICRNRHEAGIAVRGAGAAFRIIAW
jgi:hypothetical protein